jgi:hypothetical protein
MMGRDDYSLSGTQTTIIWRPGTNRAARDQPPATAIRRPPGDTRVLAREKQDHRGHWVGRSGLVVPIALISARLKPAALA